MKCILRYLERTGDHFGLGLIKKTHFWWKTSAKNNFYIFISSDLDLWPLDLKYAS